ncbi:MAG TPA: ArsC family (seleno)protein [Thermoanaerobaculia bacterium]|nr:ArsC family (seleno)protein [Thermoanaerobaculia bacterium]
MDARGIEPVETVPASRKLGREEARELVRRAKRVLVSKGKATRELRGGPRAGDEVVDALLGPTGKLRAPTLRVGDTLLVGFGEEPYREFLG